MCCCSPSPSAPLSTCYLCCQPRRYHTFILSCKLTKTIPSLYSFSKGWCKALYQGKSKVGRPYVSISFWFIRVVSAERPNITDPMHSPSNNLAIDQICSVLHRGIEGHNSFSYKYLLYLVISMHCFKHMQRSHAYTQRLSVHLTVTLLHSI